MAEPVCPDLIVYLCSNCVPEGGRLPRQWRQEGAHVLVREVPCTGKIDVQYLFRALEGGTRGVCVVACPRGKCSLVEGNYRAEVRVRTVQRLLAEGGIEPGRVELLHCSPDDPPDRFAELVRDAVKRLRVFGESPMRAGHTRESLSTKG